MKIRSLLSHVNMGDNCITEFRPVRVARTYEKPERECVTLRTGITHSRSRNIAFDQKAFYPDVVTTL